MTGQSTDGTIRLAKAISIGLAITVPGGLVAPIIKDVNKKDIFQIARDGKELIEKARSNKLAPTDLEGGCITVSNRGAFGIESFIPIVVPGQCSIFGVGRICDTCMPAPASLAARRGGGPDNGGTAIRKIMDMTLSLTGVLTIFIITPWQPEMPTMMVFQRSIGVVLLYRMDPGMGRYLFFNGKTLQV